MKVLPVSIKQNARIDDDHDVRSEMGGHQDFTSGLARRMAALASNALDLTTLATSALDAWLRWLGSSCGAIYVFGEGRLRRTVCAPTSQEDEWPILDEGCSLITHMTPTVAALPLVGTSLEPFSRVSSTAGTASMAVWPLMIHGEQVAVMLACLPTERVWSQVELDEMDLAGHLLALEIRDRRITLQIERQARESQTVYRVSRAFVSTTNLDDLLNLIVHSAVDTIPKADNCVLHLFEEATGELHPRALSFVGEMRPDATGRSRMRIGQGVAGIALETGQAMNVPDVSCDSRFIRAEGASRPYAAMLVAPLRLGNNRIGTLSVDSTQTNAFSADDVRLLTTLASQAAAAIENARLVHDLQQSLLDLRRTQDQLIQSEKLSAIGQLIAGVAHELNNPLTAVMGYTQLLRTSEGIDPDVLHDLDKIYVQAQRAAKIVENLLTFARQQKAERRFVNVNDVLERTIELRAYQLQVENIHVVRNLSGTTLGTHADANQLQQVFLNLINNAQDAMLEYRGGGTLNVTSRLEGNTILVSFADDGMGLSAEVKQHLFEPFFTTKEVGKGTGLGLSICFGITSQYGGLIRAEGEPGKGATFTVELPLAEAQPSRDVAYLEQVEARAKGRRVLIVDDESEVAEVLMRILTQDRHDAVVAHNGEEALQRLAEARTTGKPFDLVISDIKMPGLSGPALYARIRQEEPALESRMIFITGDTMSPATHNFLQSVSVPYLTKPFSVSDFRRAADRVLR